METFGKHSILCNLVPSILSLKKMLIGITSMQILHTLIWSQNVGYFAISARLTFQAKFLLNDIRFVKIENQ